MSDFVIVATQINKDEENQSNNENLIEISNNIILQKIVGNIRFFKMVTKLKLPYYQRNPINLCFVIDISNQITYHKHLNNIKESILEVVNSLCNDYLSIVLYNDKASILINNLKMDETGKRFAKKEITEIKGNGLCNLSDGLKVGLQVLDSMNNDINNDMNNDMNNDIHIINHLILISGGVPNIGITNTDSLITFTSNIKNKTKNKNKTKIHTFGVGPSLYQNESQLKKIADLTNSNYYHISDNITNKINNYLYELFMLAVGYPKDKFIKNLKLSFQSNKNIYFHKNNDLEFLFGILAFSTQKTIVTNFKYINNKLIELGEEITIPNEIKIATTLINYDYLSNKTQLGSIWTNKLTSNDISTFANLNTVKKAKNKIPNLNLQTHLPEKATYKYPTPINRKLKH